MSMDIDEHALYRSIGQRLKSRRRELRLTQKQLAVWLGVERTSVANIEAGLQKAPLHTLYRLCLLLDLEISALLPSIRGVTTDGASSVEEVQVDGQAKVVPPLAATLVRELYDRLAEER